MTTKQIFDEARGCLRDYNMGFSSGGSTSSLTEVKSSLAGCGNTSDALCAGGYSGSRVDTTEIWNGLAWVIAPDGTPLGDSFDD